jgi:hypothetical protein
MRASDCQSCVIFEQPALRSCGSPLIRSRGSDLDYKDLQVSVHPEFPTAAANTLALQTGQVDFASIHCISLYPGVNRF